MSAEEAAGNFADTAYTSADPGIGAVKFATASNFAMPVSGRFLSFRVDVAAENCSVSAPLLQFSLVNSAGNPTPAGSEINGCAGSTTVTPPALGAASRAPVHVGAYTSDGSVLSLGNSVGIKMVNNNGSGIGNDHTFDNIQILDTSPQLDKEFSPKSVKTGGTSTLTFTVTNTTELGSKNGWSFTDSLPSGLVVANPATISGNCDANTAAASGGSSITVNDGKLSVGQTACTITVQVTASKPGTYSNGPANVTETGLNPPGTTAVKFSNPELTLVKKAGMPVDVNGDGLSDAGDTIQYTFTVSNTGDQIMSNIAVIDAKAGSVTCPEPTMAVGSTQVCTADHPYVITAEEAAAKSVDNTATATGTPPGSTTPVSSKPSTTRTPAEAAAPALTMRKSASSADSTNSRVGQVIDYSFTVTNTGNVTLSDISIVEGEFSGTGTMSDPRCPSSTLAVGATEACTASYTLTRADINSGSLTNTASAAGKDPSGTPITSVPSTAKVPIVVRLAFTGADATGPGSIGAGILLLGVMMLSGAALIRRRRTDIDSLSIATDELI